MILGRLLQMYSHYEISIFFPFLYRLSTNVAFSNLFFFISLFFVYSSSFFFSISRPRSVPLSLSLAFSCLLRYLVSTRWTSKEFFLRFIDFLRRHIDFRWKGLDRMFNDRFVRCFIIFNLVPVFIFFHFPRRLVFVGFVNFSQNLSSVIQRFALGNQI